MPESLFRASVEFFIVIDPLGNVPIFVSLTEEMAEDDRRKAFRSATIVAFALLMLFSLMGQRVLEVFGIALPSFMIAGGALLLIIAIRILVFGGWQPRLVSPESVGAVPIACPLLVGPGAITTAIVLLQTEGLLVTTLAALVNFLVIWLVLRFTEPIYKFLGKTGSVVIADVIAIFIAAIAVGLIVQGVKYYFP
ncbi:MAG: MarC family protein [Candidatus Bathyarchaeia archaeon]